MKKLLFLLTMALFVSVGKATVIPPEDARGSSLNTLDFVGALPCNIDNSTGTAVVMCNSTGTNGISQGPAIVYGVVASSIAQGDYLVFKDTTGIGVTGVMLSTTLAATNLTTAAVVGNFLTNNSTSNTIYPYPTLNLIKFPVPLQFPNGISVQASGAPQSNQGLSRWTILYRPLYSTKSGYGQ